MKKFYLLILTGFLVLSSSLVRAQTTYTSILSNPGFLTLDDKNYWQGAVAPPNPCTNCTIVINSDVTVVPNDHTSSDPVDVINAPALNDVKLINCTLKVIGGVSLTVNTYIEFFDTQLLIGSDAITPAFVVLNDQADLNGTSAVQLANNNTGIDVNNAIGNTVHGPHLNLNIGDGPNAGIFGILTTPLGGANYTAVLIGAPYTIGSAAHIYGSQYNINCDGSFPNPCQPGVIYGPAITATLSDYGLIFGPATTLPVQLVLFKGNKNADESVQLSWATAQEINSASFDIERSADQGSWVKIGSVNAKGYASTTTNYSFTDKLPLAGNGYYRLKMIDLDQKFQYSYTVLVTGEKDNRPLVIYSNPFNDEIRFGVNVDRAQNLSVVVTDLVGKTYIKTSLGVQAGSSPTISLPLSASSGMYLLHISGSTYEQTVKLVKQ